MRASIYSCFNYVWTLTPDEDLFVLIKCYIFTKKIKIFCQTSKLMKNFLYFFAHIYSTSKKCLPSRAGFFLFLFLMGGEGGKDKDTRYPCTLICIITGWEGAGGGGYN